MPEHEALHISSFVSAVLALLFASCSCIVSVSTISLKVLSCRSSTVLVPPDEVVVVVVTVSPLVLQVEGSPPLIGIEPDEPVELSIDVEPDEPPELELEKPDIIRRNSASRLASAAAVVATARLPAETVVTSPGCVAIANVRHSAALSA